MFKFVQPKFLLHSLFSRIPKGKKRALYNLMKGLNLLRRENVYNSTQRYNFLKLYRSKIDIRKKEPYLICDTTKAVYDFRYTELHLPLPHLKGT